MTGTRPTIDVVVPFAGSQPAFDDLVGRLASIRLGPGDSLTVVDNTVEGLGTAGAPDGCRVVHAPERRSSYHARNVGAACGHAEWILFMDADVVAPPDLLDRYFDEEPGERTAVLAGGFQDEPWRAPGREPAVIRFAAFHPVMSQRHTMLEGPFAFAQTANCAVRRSAFERVGGFVGTLRSAGDADLSFRLVAGGWTLEPREGAMVLHRNRTSVRRLLAQRVRHGAGAAWLARRHPGYRPPWERPSRLIWWTAKESMAAIAAGLRGDRDRVIMALLHPLWQWAYELGRFVPNRVLRGGRRMSP